ncbi:MAG TPA: catalase [Stellaceae bacterium]|nr:catalase [Stellaceae bacterium]
MHNTPVFFHQDPLRFPDLNLAIKRDPRTGMLAGGFTPESAAFVPRSGSHYFDWT